MTIPSIFILTDERGEPWAALAWGRHTSQDFLRAVYDYAHVVLSADGIEPGEVVRGWGRWRKRPHGVMADEFFGDGWPIPFLNKPYTLTVFEESKQ